MNTEVRFKSIINSDISSLKNMYYNLKKIHFIFNGNMWIEKIISNTDNIRGLIKPRIDFDKDKPPLI